MFTFDNHEIGLCVLLKYQNAMVTKHEGTLTIRFLAVENVTCVWHIMTREDNFLQTVLIN